MKLVFVISLILCIAASGYAASRTTIDLMREYYFNNNPNVPQDIKDHIMAGTVSAGMSYGDVTLAWGFPDYKSWIGDGETQIWSYEVNREPCYSLLFEERKLKRIDKTGKIRFVRFEDRVRSKPGDFGWQGAAAAETSSMVAGYVDKLFDAKELTNGKFKIAEKFKDELIEKGIKTTIDTENEKVRLEPADSGISEGFPLYAAIKNTIPGLPENIVALEIGVLPLAHFIKGYQSAYAGTCTLKEEDGTLRQTQIVLNWRIGGLKKPEAFKATVCSGVREENKILVPVDERDDFKYKNGQEVFILMSFYDLEPFNGYDIQSDWYSPDGELWRVVKYHLDSKESFGYTAYNSVEVSVKDTEPELGRWKVEIYVNTFLTDIVEFTIKA